MTAYFVNATLPCRAGIWLTQRTTAFCLRQKLATPQSTSHTHKIILPSLGLSRPLPVRAKNSLTSQLLANRFTTQRPTRSSTPSRCRATSLSVPSRSLPRPRSRTALCLSGFASELATPSATTLSEGTGARPASASKLLLCNFVVHFRACASTPDYFFLGMASR